MNKRELRIAIERKLKHRRDLMHQNSQLRSDVHRAEQVRDFTLQAMKSAHVNYALEACADTIVRKIIEEALEASRVVADETAEAGDYLVGIDIPSLHIRHRIFRMDVLDGPTLGELPTTNTKLLNIDQKLRR